MAFEPFSGDPLVSCSRPIYHFISIFKALRNVGRTNLPPKIAYSSSRLYVFFTRTSENKREKVRITYPKRLVPHQKTFDLEISQIDHGRRFRSSGNGAWSICFETPHADALSGSLGTLNVKGSIGGGDFAAQ